MSKNADIYKIICKMNDRLNKVIVKNDFDLLCDEVLRYSKRLDKIIAIYLKQNMENIDLKNDEKMTIR